MTEPRPTTRTIGPRPLNAAIAIAGALLLLPAGAAHATTPSADDPAAVGAKRGKPRLVVRAISKPPKLAAVGERVKLTGKLRNRGRRAGRGQLRLIVPRRPDATSGRPLAKKFSKRVKPGGDRRFRFRFQVPAALAPEAGDEPVSYTLAACVRRYGGESRYRCRPAGRPLTIEAADGPVPLPPKFDPGARSIGDPLFPQVGNGGYDVSHYALALDYDPDANRFNPGTSTTVTATSTQDLGQFSLDFQDLDVSSVKVDGAEAFFTQTAAKPPLAGATQPMKLIVDPPAGIEQGSEFTVEVAYSGEPVEMVDPDGSSEGWVRACIGVPSPATCDGSFVVNEPNGAQGWFPANNHPSDKASFETKITAPNAKSAIGIGELSSRQTSGAKTTWTWTEDDPTATYLTTATVGDFIYTESSLQETTPARTLPVYEAIDSKATPVQQNSINAALDRSEGMINFLAGTYGSYPFDSAGAVVDNVPTLGYALEVQTRPHFATLSVPVNTLLHEYAHQWFGNTVSPATWLEIWFNEGWAEWSTWYWDFTANGDPNSPAAIFADEYDNASADDWSIPPATLDGDPANLFAHFPVYVRGALTLEAYRQIVGDPLFFQFAGQLQSRYGYGDVSTAEVIALAKEISGFSGAKLDKLDQFFQQWLYGAVKPTILPAGF